MRLKGGDPFVFGRGRGYEALKYAIKRGVNVEVIPWYIKCALGFSFCRLPLTKRGVNESFWGYNRNVIERQCVF